MLGDKEFDIDIHPKNVFLFFLQTEKMKTKETIGKLDESISIIEKQTSENKRQFEKLMSAEITQRYSKQRIDLTVG